MRALVERLAGHPGIGESSRTARLTVVVPEWRIVDATSLGDGCYALTLLRGREDASVVVTLRTVFDAPRCPRVVMGVGSYTSQDALDWCGEHEGAVQDACLLGRVS